MSDLMKINKWGHSSGIRIPDRVMKRLGLNNGDSFAYDVSDNEVILKPVKKHQSTKELFESFYGKPFEDITIKDLGNAEEIDFGRDVGSEVLDEF